VTLSLIVSPNLGDSVASISIGVVQGTPGSTVSVPVVATSVSGVTSFQFGVYFDSTVLRYQNIRLGTALMGQVVIPSITGNRVDVAYIDFSGSGGLTVCSDTLYWIDFTYSAQGGLSPLVWDYTNTLVSGVGGMLLGDVRLSNGLVYGASVTTAVPTSNGDQEVCEFADAVFAISGTGISSYQWKVSTDGGSSFVNVTNGAGVQGAQSDSLILGSVLSSMNGNLYMCVVQGVGGTVSSLVQRLRVQTSTSVALSITATPAGIQCSGTQITYSALWSGSMAGIAYTWTVNGQPAGTDSVLVRSDLGDGDLVGLEVIGLGSCEVGSATMVSQVAALPQGYVVTGGGTVCPGAAGHAVVLSGSEVGVRYILQLNGVSTGDTLTGTGASLNFGLRTTAGTYAVEARNTFGCVAPMVGFAQVTALPGVVGTVTANTTIFLGQSIQLLATGGVSYRWSPSTGLSSDSIANPVATPQVTTTYSVVITNLQGCTDTLGVVITVLPVQPVFAGADTVVCINADTVRLTGTPVGGSWSGPGIVSGSQGLFVASVAGLGVHDVVYSLVTAGISTADTLRVTVLDVSIPRIINQTICAPNSYTFNGQSYNASGTYTATLTNAVGCDSVIILNLTVNQPSATTITQTICAPNSYTFNGQSYNATGTYTATLTNAAGCDSIVTLNLTVRSCDFDLGVRTFIQGYYRPADSSMVPLLYNLSRTNDSNATDTILLSLWNPNNLIAPVFSGVSILNKFGYAYLRVPDSIRNQSYYVSINHRNSFEVWSSVSLMWSDSLVYDFTASASSAYTNGVHSPMKQLPDGRFGLYSGDVNQDGIIDAEDLDLVWLATFGSPGSDYWLTDLNADEIPDAEDLDLLWLNSFGSLAVSRP
jgi:hypothetical protein